MKSGDLIAILEAVYAQPTEDGAWLAGVLGAAAPHLNAGLGCAAYFYDARSLPFKIWGVQTTPDSQPPEILMQAMAGASPEYIEQSWKRLDAGTASEVPGWADEPSKAQFFDASGIADVLTVNAYDPSGVGCCIGTPQPALRRLSVRERATLRRVASHIAAGFRLRRALAAAEAILSPSGKLIEALGEDTKAGAARSALRDAAKDMERARGPLRRKDPEGALLSWRTLVRARWSLLDHFESDGKRFLIAMANGPEPPPVDVLPPRERQVIALAAQGHPTKIIAYELGLSGSTVRVLLARAARRLGARNTVEAVARYNALAAHAYDKE
jgi:DNA-binding CsgD family transcriptional regulator